MLLSAALIVRNEARFLEACLTSVRPVVDEIVVVDTGSTDETREIAAACGARLGTFEWRDDFAAARNHAIDLARGEWILYIDADERLRPTDTARLRALLAEPACVACQVLLHPRPGFSPYWELRLFRNDPQIRFRGVIHENIWPAVDAYCGRVRHAHIVPSDVVIDHEGYEGDQEAKHRRNVPLLEQALRDDPERVYCWCHLASIRFALGQTDQAEQAWQTALGIVRGRDQRRSEDSLPYTSLIQLGLNQGRDVFPLIDEGLARFPRNVQLQWQRGRAFMAARQWEKAIVVLERLAEAGDRGDIDRSMAYDLRLFGVFAWEALATCHFNLQRYAESERYYDRAARADPDRLEYRVKRDLSASLLRKQGT